MRVNVLRSFRDKHTKVIHHTGDELELTSERFSEVNSTRYGVLVAEIISGINSPPTQGEAVGSLEKAENQTVFGESGSQGAEDQSAKTAADGALVNAPAVVEPINPGKPVKKAK